MASTNNLMFYNRKRSRSSTEDEGSEFTPLSKRINNLHINNGVLKYVRQGEGTAVLRQLVTQTQHPNYSPDLGPAENPFYYENNRLLYNLYMERARRSGEVPY
ncbi:uncharacterized protein LOC124372846 [Homalodisca vitripennis]|uniref:Uncharacterized protein n=1 Tax=Homalodisca liturata TaxID=320908 RepID=A0A1B6J7S5_9HEMI|nr:uncharacterized protein LOC124372846 [Homalodisca vitripennis]KAG8317444.1 hypothetical protein J6590_026594 [Homalodisca vitripennis]